MIPSFYEREELRETPGKGAKTGKGKKRPLPPGGELERLAVRNKSFQGNLGVEKGRGGGGGSTDD